jgi:hypothetical protein
MQGVRREDAMFHTGWFIDRGYSMHAWNTELTDGLTPALKRRGLIRGGFPHRLFRDNLLAF